MELIAIKNFKHAEDCINVVERQKDEVFEVNDLDHAKRIIEANLAKENKPQEPKSNKAVKPSEKK